MRVQLHQADRQTVGVGIILVVLRDALAPELRRPRLKRQTILERRADIEELKQSGNAYADAGGSRAGRRRRPWPRIGAVDEPPEAGEIRLAIRRPRGGPCQVRLSVSGLGNSRSRISRPLPEES